MSPRGADSFTRHAAAVEQRREAAMESYGPTADYFGVDSGQVTVVRFLEQGPELAYAATHRVPVANRRYPVDALCLDQMDDGSPCPFCQSEDPDVRGRSTKGFINVIWRGNLALQQLNEQTLAQNQQRVAQGQQPLLTFTLAPVFKRSQNGIPEKDKASGKKIVSGYADGIFLWKCSNTVFQEILSKDSTYHGLMSRDFTVRRQGSSMQDTKYFIEPADVNSPPQAMSPADQALANAKYDLDKFIAPPSLEAASSMLVSSGPSTAPLQRGAGLQTAIPSTTAPNPFAQGGAVPPPVPQSS